MGRALAVALLAALAAAAVARGATPPHGVLFDDFTYTSTTAFEAHGWVVRSKPGAPGIGGARWTRDGARFVADPARAGNRLLELRASTDGTAAGTRQAQVCQQRRFRVGTYATRIRWTDAPVGGPDGDEVVESFYDISPLRRPRDPAYSELDWEYLPNGGWGIPAPTLYTTSWETFQFHPWWADNESDHRVGGAGGWHVLVTQAVGGVVRYFLDGAPFAVHRARYFPESLMSIDYNVWFVAGGGIASRARRVYREQVDWVFQAAGRALSPAQVLAAVARLRRAGVAYRDTVPATGLAPVCGL